MSRKTIAPILLTAFMASPAFAQSGPASTRPTMLIHGNYCGPGNNAPLAPIDALDAACARHDACTPDDGLPSKACNLRLQADAERVATDGRQPEEVRMMAGLIASGAALMAAGTPDSYAAVASAPAGTAGHRPLAARKSGRDAFGLDAP